ncbi:proprotein convertase P-domain-containing protein [Dokdonella sp.]|uniref:proprotein convertase P-domain-containing protein n=1 Tax=Dokdonella sp. TaxID=2291710 RepID=UPI00378414CC
MRVFKLQRALCGLALLLAFAVGGVAEARIINVEIHQAKGVDASVDYAQLVEYGPWDDRNYALTAADLAFLPKAETEARDPLPAFYRVWARKAAMAEGHPLPTSGPAQYPRSAVNTFLQRFDGIRIDGHTYRGINRIEGNRFEVFDEEELEDMGEGWPKFLGTEVKITTPVGAEETAIAVNPINTNYVIAGSNGPGSGQKMWRSTDGGATWSSAINLPGATCCDATVGWSTDGLIAYTSSLMSCGGSGCGVDFFRSLDNGATWTRTAGLVASGSDKEYLHVDSFAGSPFKDNIYVSWHQSNVQKFARSTDKGLTFSTPVTLDSAFKGIGSDITTDKLGNVYYFFPSTTGSNIRVVKSTDGGATFAASGVTVANTVASFDFPLPSMSTRNAFIYAAADADLSNGPYANSLYVAWPDTYGPESGTPANNHARVQVGYSRDGGATWTVTTPHPTADGQTVDRYQQWLKVDEWGRVHVVYYDTRHSSGRTGVDLYYSVSLDGAQTWEAPRRLTTVTSPKINTSMEWGDYNGMDMAMNDIIAIYTDNRAVNNGDVWGIGGFADSPGPDYALQAPSDVQYVCAGSSITPVSIKVSSLSGYSHPVTLSLPGLDGAVYSGGLFSPNPVTPPADGFLTSVLTLGTQAGASGGSHPVVVHGIDDQVPATEKEITLNVQIASGQPGAVTLTAPANGVNGVALRPVFSWGGSNTDTYKLEVATDAGFGSIILTQVVTGTTFTPTTDFSANTTYFWRVTPTNACGAGAASPTFSFTTANLICSTPAMAITDNLPAGINDSLVAAGPGTLTDLKLVIKATHTWVGDLKFTLSKGAGSSIVIDRPGYTGSGFGCSGDNIDVVIDDGSGVLVEGQCNASPPALSGNVKPNNPLATPFIGQTLAGTWTLNASDNAGGDTGTLDQWCLVPATSGGPTTYTVGGNVSGLTGAGLVLSLNAGAQTLPVAANGSFTFPTGLADLSPYAVTVGTQPTGQICTVANGSGTISGANVTNVAVTCAGPTTFTVGGNVSGLSGAGLVLSLNSGSQTLPVAANGSFTFPTGLANGTGYAVTVGTEPAGQTCAITNGSGTIAGANVTNVGVACTNVVSDVIFADGFETP